MTKSYMVAPIIVLAVLCCSKSEDKGAANRAPVIQPISDIVVNEEEAVVISPVATDPDGDNLTFAYSGWMNSNTYTTKKCTDRGTHTVTVTASDGRLSASVDVSITVNAVQSVISGIAPGSGAIVDSTIVTISGSGFGSTQGTSTVAFGGTALTPSSWSGTSIIVTVPSCGLTAGVKAVQVTTCGQASNATDFTVLSTIPAISGIAPTSGTVGTTFTLSGSGFGVTVGSTIIPFDGVTATPISWSDTSIEGTVPCTSFGQKSVQVSAACGSGSNVVSFTITQGTWTWFSTSTAGDVPTARSYHKAVWTGSEMIIWGGYKPGTYFSTGGRYDPIADTWSATTTIGAATGRNFHTAVWTGSEMIVWGGYNGSTYINTGSRYNPSTDTWQATTTSGAPLARYRHTAVWTGSEMIVWGGSDGGTYFSTGSRYNPVSDTWTATTISGAPTGRDGPTAIWTGSEMIIWGGYNGSIYLNTGGRYDPIADTWTATTTITAPSGRIFHTAIWTGTEMIVWGGTNLVTSWNTGGRYNPLLNSWTVTPTPLEAPTARDYHIAVWACPEMIVWGGYNRSSFTYLNTGGHYNLFANTWTSTTSTDAPSNRAEHAAVWTGSEMIVWGGYNGSTYTSTGGRYRP